MCVLCFYSGACARAHVCICLWRPEVDIQCLSQLLSESGSHSKLWLTSKLLGHPCSASAELRLRTGPVTYGFLYGSRGSEPRSALTWQALYRLNPSHQPLYLFPLVFNLVFTGFTCRPFFPYLSFKYRVLLCSPGCPLIVTLFPLPPSVEATGVHLLQWPRPTSDYDANSMSPLGVPSRPPNQDTFFLPELVICLFLLFMSYMLFIPMHASLV